MDFSFHKFTWILCLVYLYCVVEADDSFSSNSHLFNKDYPTNSESADDKTQFSLDNVKSVKIENGYSGILIPEKTLDKAESILANFGVNKGLIEKIKALIPKTAKSLFKFALKVGGIAITAILVVLFSSSIAAAFCSYSEICSLKFPGFGWEKDGFQSVRSLMTPEKISGLSSLVNNAINTYSDLNKKKFRTLE